VGDGAGAPVLRGAADMYVGMSDLHREHNDLKTATQHLLTSQALGEPCRVIAKPVSLVCGDGTHTGGPRRSGWRARLLDQASTYTIVPLPKCASDRDAKDTGVGGPGSVG